MPHQITKDTKGFIKDLSNKDYHDSRIHVSSSVIKKAAKEPLEYHRVYVKGEEPKPLNATALLIGDYIHCALLEPHLLHTDFAIWPGTRRGAEYKHFEEQSIAKGMQVLGKSQYDTCQEMLTNFNRTKIKTSETEFIPADTLFQGGYAEESVFTELDGVLVKARFDYRLDGDKHIIRDVKTSRSLCNTVKQTKEVIEGLEYDLSAALYIDVLAKVLGIDADKIVFEWVFLSKGDFAVNMYRASKETIERGRKAYKKGLKKIKYWRKNGYDDIFSIREV